MSQRITLLSVILFLFWGFSTSSQEALNFYIGNNSEEAFSNAPLMVGNEVEGEILFAENTYLPKLLASWFEWENEEEIAAVFYTSRVSKSLPPENFIYQFHKPATVVNATETFNPVFTTTETFLSPVFILFLFLTGLLFLVSHYFKGVYYKTRIKELRKGISSSLHDELGPHLTIINFLSTTLPKAKLEGKDLAAYLRQINSEALASTVALDEIVWNMDMKDENLDELAARMRKYSAEFLETLNLDYKIKVNSSFAKNKMRMQKRRDLFLIFKELLNNTCKHSQAGMVEITIFQKGAGIFLSVKDDGIGFDPSATSERKGIRSMTERLKKWNGDFRIVSEKGLGCSAELWLPFCRPKYRKGFIPRNRPPRI